MPKDTTTMFRDRVRELCERFHDSITDAGGNPRREDMPSVAELFEMASCFFALDDALYNGEPLPDDWKWPDGARRP